MTILYQLKTELHWTIMYLLFDSTRIFGLLQHFSCFGLFNLPWSRDYDYFCREKFSKYSLFYYLHSCQEKNCTIPFKRHLEKTDS